MNASITALSARRVTTPIVDRYHLDNYLTKDSNPGAEVSKCTS